MNKAILTVIAMLTATTAGAAPNRPAWDDFGESQVVWSKGEGKGLDRIRWKQQGKASDWVGCTKPQTSRVRVIALRDDTDPLTFRGRTAGGVNTYSVAMDVLPNVLRGWVEHMLEEGKSPMVASRMCGSGGYIYVTEIAK